MGLIDRFRNVWNVFKNKDPTWNMDIGPGYYLRPDRMRFSRGNERSIITAVFNKIAMDVASIPIQHVRLDEQGRFSEEIKSNINNCLTVEANIDQTGRAFIQDAVQSMFDEGCVALVPIDTDDEPEDSGNFSIYTLRTGRITEWHPAYVKANVYNEATGERQDIKIPKATTAIVENPMYSVMNEPSSTMQRLARKLALLDVVDEQASSGRLDMIIQLPYVIKTQARREQAEIRRKDIQRQLTEGPYGIAYTDGTEKIVQLNRPVENNLMKQIEYLTNLLFSQIGITEEILNGSADPKVMQNYYVRIIEPILSAFADEMNRKFLTKTARTQGQSFRFFRDPFKLLPSEQIAEIADKMIRNQIMTPNEMRQKLGMRPADDPKADELRNPNIADPNAGMDPGMMGLPPGEESTEEMPEEDTSEAYEPADPAMTQSAIKQAGGSGKPVPGKPLSVLPQYSRAQSPPGNRSGNRGPRGPTAPKQ